MASHYVSSSSNSITFFKNSDTMSPKINVLGQNSQIDVLTEYVGRNCEFHQVSSSYGVGYVLNQFVYRLEGTADSAPYICEPTFPNYAFVQPEWHLMPENSPYIDELTNEYCISVKSNSLTLNGVNQENVIRDGINSLFRFYNKPHDDATVLRYYNYFIFAKIKDYYVPFRPLMRTKHLIGIPTKYFNAIEENETGQSERDISKANFVLEIDLKELKSLFDSLKSLLGLYDTDLAHANVSLSFSLSLADGVDVSAESTPNSVRREMSFLNKKENVEKFERGLNMLISRNNFNPDPAKNSINETALQLVMNEECNVIYDAAIKINHNCYKLRIGIDNFLSLEATTDPTTINFIKNIHAISKIQKCKVPWYEFSEIYVFPKAEVKYSNEEEDIPSYEKYKKLYSSFISFQQEANSKPVKSKEEVQAEKVKTGLYVSNAIFSDTLSPFLKSVYQGDNVFDSTNIQKTLDSIELAINGAAGSKALEDFINKIGICKITDFANACLLALVKDLSGLEELDGTVTLGGIGAFDTNKLINEIIPFLPQEQQQLIYEKMLLELGCLNSRSLMYVLKQNLSLNEYTALNIETASYEEIVKEVAKKMSTTIENT